MPISAARPSTSRIVSLIGKTAFTAATILIAKKLFSASARRDVDLRNKIVLITGGSRGLGLALAHEFGTRGSRLALCARDRSELNTACEGLRAKSIEATPFTCDVTKQSEISSLVEDVVDRFGRLDVLINNAGFIKVGSLASFDHSDFERAMEVMFWAPVNLTLAALPHMRKQRSGHIVNITSVGARVSVPHLLPYSCAKFALAGFSTGLSTELKAEGIHVLTVVPGLMRTGSYLNAEFTGEAAKEFALFSILGNLPGFSVSAEYAARCVRRALEKQQYTCTISVPAKLLIASEALLPETTRATMELVNRVLLPKSNQSHSITGKTLNPKFGTLFQALTTLGKQAALRFNE